MDKEEIIDCEGMKYKGSKLVCSIARTMQESDINVAFSEIEDALKSIDRLNGQIKDIDDLKAVIKSSLAKNEKADGVFNKAFDYGIKDLVKEKKAKKEKEVEEALK